MGRFAQASFDMVTIVNVKIFFAKSMGTKTLGDLMKKAKQRQT